MEDTLHADAEKKAGKAHWRPFSRPQFPFLAAPFIFFFFF
jgi:hypothetical protein